ncbi:PaaI family thioesterase [Streptomyces hokutonensis]|uniref:PaaI family thioesterase n=1 Tax=Streptomyces hokutonensis TaxID=1306990 RepID=UPI0036748291
MTRTTGGAREVGEAGGATTPTGLLAGADFQDPPRTPGGVALCGACRAAGSCRLGVEGERLDADGVAVFELSCPRDQEGGPNVAHGGWTAAVLDDCLGHLPLLHRVLSVTAELSVSFVKPVPVERPLEVRAWVERRDGRRWYIAGEMVLLPTRAVLARVSGIWVTRDQGHFARHEKWLAEQEAEGDSAGNGNGEGQ